MPEYDAVDDWNDSPKEPLLRPQGWARRPDRDDGLYGPTYMFDECREILVGLFELGSAVSSDKMGPAQMQQVLKEMFPGCYRIPGETEIAKLISALFQKEKAGKDSRPREHAFPKEMETRIRDLIDKYPNETGKPIEARLAKSYGRRKPEGYNRQKVMLKVNQWRTSKRAKERK